MIQPSSLESGPGLDVISTMYCMSRQVREGLASSASAHMPAASGAEAEVPAGGETVSQGWVGGGEPVDVSGRCARVHLAWLLC